MNKRPLKVKSYTFAVEIVRLCQDLQKAQKEFVLSKQLLRSGTAIGALVKEAEFAQSKLDFIHKMSIALKEANETLYWLSLLKDTNYLDNNIFIKQEAYCKELIALLVTIIKTTKNNLK
jgi:four helix bundle protein